MVGTNNKMIKNNRTLPVGLFIVCMLAVIANAMSARRAYAVAPVRIAVLTISTVKDCKAAWTLTADYLANEIPGRKFEIVCLSDTALKTAATNKAISYFISTAPAYVELENSLGAIRIASLNINVNDIPTNMMGSVVFTRKDSGIRTASDMLGKTFAASDRESFGGWIAAMREFRELGMDPDHSFSRVVIMNDPEKVVRAVASGDMDTGVVRTGLLETMSGHGDLDLDEIRIIRLFPTNRIKAHYPLLLSTRIYPEWPIAALPWTDTELTHKIAVALLQMPPDSEAAMASRTFGWTFPQNYESVRECLKALGIPPYDDFSPFSLRQLISHYGRVIVAFAFVFIILCISVLFLIVSIQHRKKLEESLRVELNERIRAENEIRDTEAFFRRIIEMSPTVMTIIKSDGTFVPLNDKYKLLTGYDQDEISNIDNWWTLAYPDPDMREYVITISEEAVRYSIETGRESIPIICTVTCKDGSTRDVEFRYKHLGDSGLWVLNDVTIQKSIEKQLKIELEERKAIEIENEKLIQTLQDKNAELNRFSYSVSHDLKAPLVTILGFIDLLIYREDIPENTDTFDYVMRIKKAASRMRDLIDGLLEVSCIGFTEELQANVDVNLIVHQTIEFISGSYRSDAAFVVQPDLPSIRGSRIRITQVFQNIIANSLKYMGEQPHPVIEISCQPTRDCYHFSIRDNGIGVAPENIERIFDLFRKIERQSEGVGLGLALVKRIVELHGGRIWAASDGLGTGTAIHFTFPY